MLKLKLQYFGHLMRRADSFGKTLLLRKFQIVKAMVLKKVEGQRTDAFEL